MDTESGKYTDNTLKETFIFKDFEELIKLLNKDGKSKNGLIEIDQTGSVFVFNDVDKSAIIEAIKSLSENKDEDKYIVFNSEKI